MSGFCIQTKSNKYFSINEKSQISYLDNEQYHQTPSDSWTCTGFKELLPFGHLGPTISAEDLLQRSDAGHTTFRNGKPRFRLADNDHGTTRIWGDGIVSIWATNN